MTHQAKIVELPIDPTDPLEYSSWVERQWTSRRGEEWPDLRHLFVMTTGLGGEAGEVQELLKKHVRDEVLDTDELKKELGDVLYYLTRISMRFGFSLADVMAENVRKLHERNLYGKGGKEPSRLEPNENSKFAPTVCEVFGFHHAPSFVDGKCKDCR